MKTILFLILMFAFVLNVGAAGSSKAGEVGYKKLSGAEIRDLNQGIKHFVAKQYEPAEAEFNSVIASNPKNSLAYYNLGLTKYRMGDYPEAIRNFDAVTKMPTPYKGAAYYYKAIAQLNLGQNKEALETATKYKQANFFYQPSRDLAKAIKSGSDEYYENAKAAEADGNYELCLVEINQSVLTDTYSGRELTTKCLAELGRAREAYLSEKNYYKLYLDTFISQSDNIYQKNSGILTKQVYIADVGGEYLFRNKVDVGVGFNYNHVNAVDLARFKVETWGFHIPFYYRSNAHYMGLTPFYDLNKFVDKNSFSDAGSSFFYTYTERNKYRLGFNGGMSERTSLDANFDYKAGNINYIRLFGTYFIDQFSVSANTLFEQNDTGDLPMGPFVLPYANNALGYGVEFSYDFDRSSILKLKYSQTEKDFLNIFSPNGTDRKDKLTRTVLTYHYIFNRYIKAFIQQSLAKNVSNYAEDEFINKNYKENVTALGLSLITY